ncbi:hypothetical protein GWI33_007965 [Rhynchophorus ferrugineus]|uniref:Uncharacterized protein n=1 Tax=Rhynchophorus ferrugineus TaxID=354439 RepID=A0A834IJ09_RHYFE|nr:hypothetical protein GWI33_007965 [Rhynchophorus ferrugineus]
MERLIRMEWAAIRERRARENKITSSPIDHSEVIMTKNARGVIGLRVQEMGGGIFRAPPKTNWPINRQITARYERANITPLEL